MDDGRNTLSDDDITTDRPMSRRSSLAAVGGALLGAAAVAPVRPADPDNAMVCVSNGGNDTVSPSALAHPNWATGSTATAAGVGACGSVSRATRGVRTGARVGMRHGRRGSRNARGMEGGSTTVVPAAVTSASGIGATSSTAHDASAASETSTCSAACAGPGRHTTPPQMHLTALTGV